jgi:tRNA modification GTPase
VESIGIERTMARARNADLRVFIKATADSETMLEPGAEDIVLVGKADVQVNGEISGRTGQGVDQLIERITGILETRMAHVGAAIRARHRVALERAGEDLEVAISALEAGAEETEIVAEHVRQALMSLDSLVGRVDVEHVLDEIFSNFCIGK